MDMKNPADGPNVRSWIKNLGVRFGNIRNWPSCGCKAVYGSKGRPEMMVDDRKVALPCTWDMITCVT